MKYRMIIVGSAEGTYSGENGENVYLKSYDPDGNNGFGDIEITIEPSEAMLFEDSGKAMEEWKRVSTVRPLRTDGKPNRPLSAYTVQIESIENSNEEI